MGMEVGMGIESAAHISDPNGKFNCEMTFHFFS